MNDDDEDDRPSSEDDSLIPFPQSRTRPNRSAGGFRDLGLSRLAREVGMVQPNLKGHWCSRCRGIWFGFVGEVECPVCGNRSG